jgi:hypothetical protein
MVIVELPEPGAGMVCGLKLTVTPEGLPEADKLIAASKPPLMAEVMVELPWLPCCTLNEAGEADSAKLTAAVTVRVTVAVRCKPPPLPVTVMGYVPVGVLAPTVIVMVELPDPGAGIVAGLKLTVVPDGMPDADKLIAPLKPPVMADVMVELP